MSAIKQYPKPTGAYKVKVKNGNEWANFENCRIQMSLRNDKYEDDKLFALLEWAYNRFNKVDLIVSDSLVRHNLMFEKNLNERDAYIEAISMGDQWLAKYRNVLKSFNINVSRWDDWLEHKDYKQSYESVVNQHNQGQGLQQAIKNTIDRFWMRQQAYNKKSYNDYAPCGTNYMLEELAVFNCMFPEKAVEVYAGQWCGECVDAIIDSKLEDDTLSPYHYGYYIEVDMSRNKGYMPSDIAA
jgi:tRNA-dependent cyclodipeptide synthase